MAMTSGQTIQMHYPPLTSTFDYFFSLYRYFGTLTNANGDSVYSRHNDNSGQS